MVTFNVFLSHYYKTICLKKVWDWKYEQLEENLKIWLDGAKDKSEFFLAVFSYFNLKDLFLQLEL